MVAPDFRSSDIRLTSAVIALTDSDMKLEVYYLLAPLRQVGKDFRYREWCIWMKSLVGMPAMSTKAKRKEEYESRIKQALVILNEVSNDNTTPRNIRRAAKTALDTLQGADLSLGVRAANAISILDDISQDPNMPPYTRTKIWNIVSLIEAIKD